MRVAVLIKFRRHIEKRQRRYQRDLYREANDPLNLYRPRLNGFIEEDDRVLADIDRLIKSNHDKWHDRKKR